MPKTLRQGRPEQSPHGLPRTAQSTRPQRVKREIFEIVDSEGTEEIFSSQSKQAIGSSFAGIMIPETKPELQTRSLRKTTKRLSNSSASSVQSPSPYEVAGYATPATSVAATPTESVVSDNDKRKRTRSTRLALAQSSKKRGLNTEMEIDEDVLSGIVESAEASALRRGRRSLMQSVEQVQEDNDAELAIKLQEEEYAEEPAAKRFKSNVGKSLSVMIDSEDDELSSAISLSSEDEPIISKRKSAAKKPKKAAKTETKIPSYTSRRASAKKAKAKLSTSAISDSEDDEEEDDFVVADSDSDLAHFSDESLEESDDDGSDDDGAGNPANNNLPWQANNFANWRANRQEARRLARAQRERHKLEKSHPELVTMWKDLEAVAVYKPTPAKQPTTISRTLKSFQLEGLDWLINQESTQWKGGLLGDEMGMGKTIQAVSLIMSDYPARQPTLVVVPPVALMQWSNEINQYTGGKLKVLVYHGTNSKSKKMSVKELKNYDVIMISYSSLESIYRKEVKGWTRGNSIVKEDSAIHAIFYHRLILDEAHSIKSRNTGVAKACFALNGTYKWCLSGTPVQNRIGEFFSLLRFLDVRPFANYFCKSCPCSSPHWDVDQLSNCKKCKHRGLEHVSVFNQEILNPITSTGDDSEKKRREALRKLRLLTDRIMLRRMKRDNTASMELPPKEVIIHNEFFGEVERDFSSSIMTDTGRKFDTYVSRGVMLNNYANIFGLIMQMRQVSDHPDLLLKKHAQMGQNVLCCNICDEPAEDAIRSGCKHDFCRACAKEYVGSCNAAGTKPDCPRCHILLSIDLEMPEIEQDEESVKKSSIINRIKMENWTSSTKIEMLVYDLYKLRSKKQTLKSIVFSQFTSMLQLVEWRLRRAGFTTVMLDGSMTPQQRQNSIEHFMTNPECEVFLVSLKAGGVALNLTEASRIFIVDPWWNPAAEWQSADRCHRIGQRRPCVITRLCIEDSVESRIVMLQEKKAALINGTVNGDDVAMDKLTPEDMQFLFRGS